MSGFITRSIDTLNKFVDLSGNRPRQAENSQSHTNIQRRRRTPCTKLSSHFCSTMCLQIFEKIVPTYIIDVLKDNSVFYNYQFGFRKNHYTSHVIITLTLMERVSKALDMGKYVDVYFRTLIKGFRLNLIQKL